MSNKIDLEFNENFKGGLQNFATRQPPPHELGFKRYMGSNEMGMRKPIPTPTPIPKFSDNVLDRVEDIQQIIGKNEDNDISIQARLYDISVEISNIKWRVNNSIEQINRIKNTLQYEIREIDDLMRSLSDI